MNGGDEIWDQNLHTVAAVDGRVPVSMCSSVQLWSVVQPVRHSVRTVTVVVFVLIVIAACGWHCTYLQV